jgi:hypothetical protein
MPIKFTKAYSIYNKGDVAAFTAETAERLVSSGVASYVHPPARPSVQQKMVKKGK